MPSNQPPLTGLFAVAIVLLLAGWLVGLAFGHPLEGIGVGAAALIAVVWKLGK